MPHAPEHCQPNMDTTSDYDRSEIMSGMLYLRTNDNNSNINVSRPQRVFVRIYRTDVQHFAVLYPVRALVTACKPLGTVNLKSCRLECEDKPASRFRLSPRGAAVTLSFEIPQPDIDSKEKWLTCLSGDVLGEATLASFSGRVSTRKQSKVSTIGRLLPVLDEEEEQCI